MIPGLEIETSGPFVRGDYLIALDFRDEGLGTYGFLTNGDGRVWIVEGDEIVGGPMADTTPEFNQVVEAWRSFSARRHEIIMAGIAAMPHGCLEGCQFDVYQNGQYVGRRIEY